MSVMAKNENIMFNSDTDSISGATATDTSHRVNINVTTIDERSGFDVISVPLGPPVCTSTPSHVRIASKVVDSFASFSKQGDTFQTPSLFESGLFSFANTPSPTLGSFREKDVIAASSPSNGESDNKLASLPITPIMSIYPFSTPKQHAVSTERDSGFSEMFMSSSLYEQTIHSISIANLSLEGEAQPDDGYMLGSSPFWNIDEDRECETSRKAFKRRSVTNELEHFDIIGELHKRQAPAGGVVDWLSQYLTPKDFIKVCGVCRSWREICLQNKDIRNFQQKCHKKSTYSESGEKENFPNPKKARKASSRNLTSSGCMGNVQLAVPSPLPSHTLSQSLYERVRKDLRWEETLKHCPMCQNVAKVSKGGSEAWCQNVQCRYQFCTVCQTSHPYRDCPRPTKTNRDGPGSKKSKKHLKRMSKMDS